MKRFGELDAPSREQVSQYINAGQYYLLTGSGTSLDSHGADGPMPSAESLRSKLVGLKGVPALASLQQVYSLLSPEEIDQHLTHVYNCVKPGETARVLSSRLWKRVYTFNIDNNLEEATKLKLPEVGGKPYHLESKHFTEDFSDIDPEKVCSVVHLHGMVTHPDLGYVFSQSEYAKNAARMNSWMLTLTQMIRSEPFVIAGTSLDEPDVAYYLEQRLASGSREDTPPSILIEPNPNALTEQLCDRHGFVLFEGTTLEFFESVDPPPLGLFAKRIAERDGDYAGIEISPRDLPHFSSVFERVPSSVKPEPNPGRFLLGNELTWEMLEAQIDVGRAEFSTVRSKILNHIKDPVVRFLVILDDPGTGKTAFLKRLAYEVSKTVQLVFYHNKDGYINDDICAEVLDDTEDDIVIFVDNWADSSSFIYRVFTEIERKTNILVVCTERHYRMPYLSDMRDRDDHDLVERKLKLTANEAERLIDQHERRGLSSLGQLRPGERVNRVTEISGDPISIAACRIQNNYKKFDEIVSDIIRDGDRDELFVYLVCAIARYCFGGGVRFSVLNSIDRVNINKLLSPSARFPIKFASKSERYVLPRQHSVADRVLRVTRKNNRAMVKEAFVALALVIAPYVNREQIRRRSPDSRLSGRLLDFDALVKEFINEDAEKFYEDIKDSWEWNSRYWEQVSLLKFDRYKSDPSDYGLLREAIQHARHAYALEKHPLSLTTLAQLLFASISSESQARDELFNEAWIYITQSIEIEKRWDNVKATAFIVCFKGVKQFTECGGLLTGAQSELLRDIIQISKQLRLRDRTLIELRDHMEKDVLGNLD